MNTPTDTIEIGLGSNSSGAVTTLRGWLDRLAETGRLAVIRPGVALNHELAAISNYFDGKKATFFPRPGGHAMPVVSGLLGDRNWIAEAMGTASEDLLTRYRAATSKPISWNEVASPPVQEVIHRGDISISDLLPVPTHNELDNGAYITAGLAITRNPRTGVQNVSIHRCQISGPNRIGILMLPRHTHYFFEMAEQRGEALEIAIVIGADPLTMLASQAIVPVDFDELEIAGALHGQPLEVTRCVTKELYIPANAEIALEGRLLPKVREPEGPFGEFPQYYGRRANRHVVEIDAITHRKDAIFHTIVGGAIEHLLLGGIPREATILDHLQRSFPSVLDVHLARGGVCRYHLYVQMRQRNPGEARNVILGALSAHYDVKHVVVVDEDVDIHNPIDVEWAVATRSQADRDWIVVPATQGSKLDPSANKGVSAKAGIDATKPVDCDDFTFKRIRVPGEEDVNPVAVLNAVVDWRKALTA